MKDVVGGTGTIGLRVIPVEVMVVDKCAVKNDPVVRFESLRDHVRSICRTTAINRGPELPLRIGLHDHSPEIGDVAIYLVELVLPPFGNSRIKWIEGVEAADLFWHADVHGNAELDSVRTKCGGNPHQLRNEVVVENVQVGIDVRDSAAVDANGRDESGILGDPSEVRSDAA